MPSAFSTRSRTYRGLNWELESLIKRRFSLGRGSVGAYRWKKAGGDYSEWRVEVYWREGGVLRHKTLGKLKEVIQELRSTGFVID